MSTQHHRRPTCRLCGGKRLTEVVKLVPTPPANAFVPASELDREQERFPLDVFFCEDCAHVQLLDVVDPRVLFEHYVYVSGTSPVFVRHFEDYAAFVMERFKPVAGGLVLDIGSNDGTLLSFFQKAGMRVLGIDPAQEISAEATARGIPTICGFFGADKGAEIAAAHGKAEVITANNVFAHIDDLSGVVDGVRGLLSPSGVFVFEVSYLVDVFENTLFDTIYHEHLDYHSVKPLIRFFAAKGMELVEAIRVGSHGGSLRGIAQLKGGPHAVGASVAEAVALEERLGLDRAATLAKFAADIEALGAELNAVLKSLKAAGKRVGAFGAPAKATTLMYHFGIGPELVDFIIDDSPLKQGLYSPGMHIPVVSSADGFAKKPDYLVILAWNFAKAIIDKNAAFRSGGGKFIIPIPKVEVV
ncbi:class I SAM-dependent methyltransferase [Paramagnetospirillum magneticum]|uniref:SAM-dependent methyltransferase n=1 Tax=Paramagnetospirillum magneticum (strain ATCC 700264 / AMB-1) TaxID=342108 RepID=Q2WB31_PARM1|nr:class I SAM-dependent methyltransferase [Paramagnetospirillum magneticum]BAE48944.1 SAM-dependent methyltransferase [Paramagnetospirillum magneticum AMB-1]